MKDLAEELRSGEQLPGELGAVLSEPAAYSSVTAASPWLTEAGVALLLVRCRRQAVTAASAPTALDSELGR